MTLQTDMITTPRFADTGVIILEYAVVTRRHGGWTPDGEDDTITALMWRVNFDTDSPGFDEEDWDPYTSQVVAGDVAGAQRWASKLVAEHAEDLHVAEWVELPDDGRFLAHLTRRVHHLAITTQGGEGDTYDMVPAKAQRLLERLRSGQGALVIDLKPAQPGTVARRRHIPVGAIATIEELITEKRVTAADLLASWGRPVLD